MTTDAKYRRESNVDAVEIESVIHVSSVVGDGLVEVSPVRRIDEYYTMDGVLLVRLDRWKAKKISDEELTADERAQWTELKMRYAELFEAHTVFRAVIEKWEKKAKDYEWALRVLAKRGSKTAKMALERWEEAA